MKNRWWLAAGLVLNLGLAPLALAQEGKGDAMKEKGAMKGDAMKDEGDKMGKH